ncbi:GNAT family N-acetyltransferase [Flavobacterium sp.]|uniref:GNAT family N-acetyltransferase n=1 Tax=Flavobacterium sp. TaxID=239 RepID=UPI00262E44D7|nr:GNAT family N-acetyltransferase [Flavobacterium sp.]
MIKIEIIKTLTENEFSTWGHNGYESYQIFTINVINQQESISFSLSLKSLEEPYLKHWEIKSADIDTFNEIIKAGHSFGAYEDDRLIGIVICEERTWNNSLHIESILVSEKYRQKGIGKLLIEKVIVHAEHKNFRLIELETQNTNVPAIKFYQNQGFKITGINMKLYNEEKNEMALYMTYDILIAKQKTTNR